jgi:hypothetical protein
VTNNSEAAVAAYLVQHHLDAHVGKIIGRDDPDPALMKPSPYRVRIAVGSLRAEPGDRVFIGGTVTDVLAGLLGSVAVIGYANKPGKADALSQAGGASRDHRPRRDHDGTPRHPEPCAAELSRIRIKAAPAALLVRRQRRALPPKARRRTPGRIPAAQLSDSSYVSRSGPRRTVFPVVRHIQHDLEIEANELFPGRIRRVELLQHDDAPMIDPGQLMPRLVFADPSGFVRPGGPAPWP